MNLDRIMSNIYGDSATQSFEHISLSGGAPKILLLEPKIEYIESSKNIYIDNEDGYDNSFHNEYSIHGGGKHGKLRSMIKNAEVKIMDGVGQIENQDLHNFMNQFYLTAHFANPPKNMIAQIPPSDEMKSLEAEANKIIKAAGAEPGSVEAHKALILSSAGFKDYVWSVYGKDSNNNQGFPYRLPVDAIKDGKTSEVCRRTNKNGSHAFFQVKDGKILVSSNPEMKDSITLKLIGLCDNDFVIVQGKLPTLNKGHKDSIKTHSMSGGGPNRNKFGSTFLKMLSEHDDLNEASYEFLSSVALSEAESIGVPKAAAHMAKYFSGNTIHSAMAIIHKSKDFDIANIYRYENDDLNEMQHKIINAYKPERKNINTRAAKSNFDKIYNNSKSSKNGATAGNYMIKNIKRMYSDIGAPDYMFPADVACSMCMNDRSDESVANAINTMDYIDHIEDSPKTIGYRFVNSTNVISKRHNQISSPLVDSIYKSIKASPFIGIISKEYIPLPDPIKSIRKRAFEDGKPSIDSFEFDITRNEPDEERMPTKSPEETPEDQPKEKPIVDDIEDTKPKLEKSKHKKTKRTKKYEQDSTDDDDDLENNAETLNLASFF